MAKRKKRPIRRRSVKRTRLIKTGSEENFRTRAGLTQLELAMLLNVKKSAIVAAEHNLRSLPSNALIKLSQLMQKFESTSLDEVKKQALHPTELTISRPCSKASARMLIRAGTCEIQCMKLNRELINITAAYDNLRKWIYVVEQLMEEEAGSTDKSKYADWEDQHKAATRRLNKCGIAAQLVLKNKIALLTEEAALNRRMEEGFSKGLPEAFKEPIK